MTWNCLCFVFKFIHNTDKMSSVLFAFCMSPVAVVLSLLFLIFSMATILTEVYVREGGDSVR